MSEGYTCGCGCIRNGIQYLQCNSVNGKSIRCRLDLGHEGDHDYDWGYP